MPDEENANAENAENANSNIDTLELWTERRDDGFYTIAKFPEHTGLPNSEIGPFATDIMANQVAELYVKLTQATFGQRVVSIDKTVVEYDSDGKPLTMDGKRFSDA